MRTRTITVIVAIIVVLGFVGYVALARNNDDSNNNDSMANMNASSSSSNSDTSSDKAVATDKVEIEDFSFSPDVITVKVGTKVTWTNKDTVAHTVTADVSSADAPSSELLGKDQSYSFTFTKAGTYAYHCQPHPNMTAKVIVTE
jgi:amicyanin